MGQVGVLRGKDLGIGVLHLRPPLFQAWKCFQGFRSEAPIATPSVSFLVSEKCSGLALDTSTGTTRWEYRIPQKETGPLFLASGNVCFYVNPEYGKKGAQRIDVLDVETGKRVRSVQQRGRSHMGMAGDLIVSGLADELECWSLQSGETLWRLELGGDLKQWMLDQPLVVTPEVTVFGVRGGRIRCIRTRTGELVWEASVADLQTAGRTGDVIGSIECFNRVLVVPLFEQMLGISLDTGKRLWQLGRSPLPGAPRCGDRLYVDSNREGWGWVDPQSGNFHPLPRLENPRGFLRYFGGVWLVSSTHFFKTLWGWIDAWDKETGKLVWSGEAKGAQGYLPHAPMKAASGRLYYRDSTYHTYCFEEVEPSDPVLKAERVSGRSNPSPEALASGVMKATVPLVPAISKETAKTKVRASSRARASKAVARRAKPGKKTTR